jgi:hypothetical protein
MVRFVLLVELESSTVVGFFCFVGEQPDRPLLGLHGVNELAGLGVCGWRISPVTSRYLLRCSASPGGASKNSTVRLMPGSKNPTEE